MLRWTAGAWVTGCDVGFSGDRRLVSSRGPRVLSLSSRKRLELPRVLPAPRMTTFPPVPVTGDAVRNKCREMLTAALQTDRECPLDSWSPAHCCHLVLGGRGGVEPAGGWRELLPAGDHAAVSADCESLSAQIEEYILCAGLPAGVQGCHQAQLPLAATVLAPLPGCWVTR